MRIQRAAIALAAVGGALAIAHRELPDLVAWKLRDELADRGFPDARFRVVAVETDRIELADVELAPGFALGTVEIDAGVSLLWRDPGVLSIRGARIRGELLARFLDDDGAGLPAREVRIADSVIELDATTLEVSGRVITGGAVAIIARAPEWKLAGEVLHDVQVAVSTDLACSSARRGTVSITACTELGRFARTAVPVAFALRSPTWTAQGTATLALGKRIVVDDGHAEVRLPSWSSHGFELDQAVVAVELAGPVDALAGTAQLRAKTARLENRSPSSTFGQVSWLELTDFEAGLDIAIADRGMRARPIATSARRLTAATAAGPLRAERVTIAVPWGAAIREVSNDWRVTPVRIAPEPVTMSCEQLLVADVALREVTLQADDASAGASFEAVRAVVRSKLGAITVSHPRGSVSPAGAIAWRGRSASWHGAVIASPVGTSHGNSHDVRAASARWNDTIVDGPAVRVRGATLELSARAATAGGIVVEEPRATIGDALELRARRVRWGDAIAEWPVALLHDGELVLHAPTARWRDTFARALVVTLPTDALEAVGSRSATWSVGEIVRGGDTVRGITGRSTPDTHELAWRSASIHRLALGGGEVTLVAAGETWRIDRAKAAAYGGTVALARPAMIDEAIRLDVRGLQLGALLAAVSPSAAGVGVLAGTIRVRGGELEGIDLLSTRGSFQIGTGAWLDDAAQAIAAGQVAVPQRIGGALADFRYDRLALALTGAGTPVLRIQLRGTGRRIPQALDLVINIRGLRDAATVLARAWEST